MCWSAASCSDSSNIERIAASVSEVCESNRDTASIKRSEAAIQEADTAIENLWKTLSGDRPPT